MDIERIKALRVELLAILTGFRDGISAEALFTRCKKANRMSVGMVAMTLPAASGPHRASPSMPRKRARLTWTVCSAGDLRRTSEKKNSFQALMKA